MIRTLDPRFPKPVLYQAELYPEFRLDPLPDGAQKGNMVRMSASWPLGLGGRRWWLAASGLVALLGLALALDRPLSAWAQDWPAPVRAGLEQLTAFGESGWILYPAAGLFVVTAALALMVRWALMRTLLGQFAALYAFIFAGVGLPVLVTALAAHRARRPGLFETEGLLSFQPNWASGASRAFRPGTPPPSRWRRSALSPRWFPAVLGSRRPHRRVASRSAHYPSDGGRRLRRRARRLCRAWAFAGRGWMFRRDRQGGIAARPLASLARYGALKRRGSGRAPRRGRP